jgi:E3 ubiquitin-protein ligase RNF14
MRLWELEGGDDGEFGQGFQGGGAAGEPVEWSDEESDDEEEPPFPPLPVELAVPQQHLPQAPAQHVQAVVVRLPGPAAPAAPRQDRQQAAAQRVPRANVPRRNDNPGLQRALRMIQDDEEDEWDSDEMDDLDDWE